LSGIGPSELIVLVVVGLLILGPERLPRVATQIGRWVGRARRTANQLRYQLEREITLADIEGKKKEKEKEQQARKSAEPPDPSDTDKPEATDISDPEADDTDISDPEADDTDTDTEADGISSAEAKSD
jgi:sec-independent protein translocase protein TatB